MCSCTGNGIGGGGIQRLKNQYIQNFWVQYHWGGVVFYLDAPPRPKTNFQVLAAAQSDGAIPQTPRHPVGYSGAFRQALVGDHHRQVESEGSLSPTLAGSLDTDRIQRVGEGRGEQESGQGRFGRSREFY